MTARLASTPSTRLSARQRGRRALLDALADPATYGGRPRVSVHETHASWVFVAGDRAYKVKKPVALGFLDYSTLARRRRACREEVRVNRELAPGIYLGVRAIVRDGAGFRLAADGARNAIEYAVEMRSFREQDTLEGLIDSGSLTRAKLGAVARRLADFHRTAPVCSGFRPDQVLATWSRNVEELQQLEPPPDWHVEVAGAFGESFVGAHAPELRQRSIGGLVRDGHGDLRCEHVLIDADVRIVDRIEFDAGLRCLDVACDLAFLAMDLEARGQRWAARELCSAYRRAGMDPGGSSLRSFYAAHCALVRAKVALISADLRAGEHEQQLQRATQLWALGERLCWRARMPVAVVICGPAASGKSTLARELSRRSGMPAVASDAVRKRLARLGATEHARAEHYSARFTRATYEALGRDAAIALRDGEGVIVDATCRTRTDRDLLLESLQRSGATRLVVRCEVPIELARARAAGRLLDPDRISDATPRIVEEQHSSFEELDELRPERVLRLDTRRHLHSQVAEVALAVDRLSSSAQEP